MDEYSEIDRDEFGRLKFWEPRDKVRFDLYKKTGNFSHLMALFCAELETPDRSASRFIELPCELIFYLRAHFQSALNAETDQEARIALGVGKNKDGGPAQRRTAKNEYEHARLMGLLDSMETGLFKIDEADRRYEKAAELTGYKKESVKTIRYTLRPKSKE